MPRLSLVESSRPFLAYLEEWYLQLSAVPFSAVVGDAPEQVAILSVDMINGFCKEGPLAGPRVGALIPAVVQTIHQAYALGVRAFILAQDTHSPQAPEFATYPPHCIAGTTESQAVAELAELPFAGDWVTVEKNSLSSHLGTTFGAWLAAHPEVTTFVVIGNCTDLCVYSAAMHLRLEANALNLQRRVVVPASVVNTFDTSISVAHEFGIMAHHGDLHHMLFLHSMAQNGVEVVKELN